MSRRSVIASVIVVLLVSCGVEPEADPTNQSFDGAWLLVSGTLADEPITMVDDYPITMTIEGEEVGGTAACNGYGGKISIDGRTVEFDAISVTEMACGDFDEGGVMESESQFLEALAGVDTIDGGDGKLHLGGDQVEMTFAVQPPVPTSQLLGTVWVLDGLISGDAVSSVSGERATLELFTDGSLIGSTGCRSLSGTYVVSGSSVQFTNFSANGECPQALSPQDDHVITVLGDGFMVEIEGTRLTLTSQGAEGLTYTASP